MSTTNNEQSNPGPPDESPLEPAEPIQQPVEPQQPMATPGPGPLPPPQGPPQPPMQAAPQYTQAQTSGQQPIQQPGPHQTAPVPPSGPIQTHQAPYYQYQQAPYYERKKVGRRSPITAIWIALSGSLLAIIASFLPWFSDNFGFGASTNALDTHNSPFGVFAFMIAIGCLGFCIAALVSANTNPSSALIYKNVGKRILPKLIFLITGYLIFLSQIGFVTQTIEALNLSDDEDFLDYISFDIGTYIGFIGSIAVIVSSHIIRKNTLTLHLPPPPQGPPQPPQQPMAPQGPPQPPMQAAPQYTQTQPYEQQQPQQ